MAGHLVTELGRGNRVRIIWGIGCKLPHGAERPDAVPKAVLPQGLERSREAVGWPRPLLAQALLCGRSPPLAFITVTSPLPFSFGQGFRVFFLQMEKMRHRLRWQGKGQTKVSFFVGCLPQVQNHCPGEPTLGAALA